MVQINNPHIKLKEKIDSSDYADIINLQKICLQYDQTTLKLELDYKKNRAEFKSENLKNINEFMYYDENKLIGYIGICNFGGNDIEVNGMTHPEYRKLGIFRKLFSLVKYEWEKSESQKMLLLSDNHSISGLEFIKYTGAAYNHSEYEMYLRNYEKQHLKFNNVVLRKAMSQDAKEIIRQNSIYFGENSTEENVFKIEEEEECGSLHYLAEVEDQTIGKVFLELNDGVGGIYGLGVIPEYRGKGYGREILVQAINKLIDKGSKDIMLQVATNNKGALNIYKSCGFEETSKMDYYEISISNKETL